MRILCNSCKKWKNIRKDTYEKMLNRFSIARGMLYGMTVGVGKMLVSPKSIASDLSAEKTIEAFEKNYICRDCRNNKKENIDKLKRISEILNLKK